MQTFVKPYTWTWLLTAMLFALTFNLSAQDQPIVDPVAESATLKGPVATIEFNEFTYDFGIIEEGEIVSHTYTFTNTSDELLVLSNARGSCGCTVPQWPREAIIPGETASITVDFNSKNKKGKRNQKVILTANTNPPQTFIYLTGEVFLKEKTIVDISIEEEEVKVNSDCFAIFPNPTAEVLKLEMEESNLGKSAIVNIYSQTGQLMAERETEFIESTIEFSVAHYPAGTYIATVQVDGRKPESLCFMVVD